MKRDASGWPDGFVLDSRTAEAVEAECERIRAEKIKGSRVPLRRPAKAPSAVDGLLTRKRGEA